MGELKLDILLKNGAIDEAKSETKSSFKYECMDDGYIYILKAAQGGEAEAQYTVGMMYAKGEGVIQNFEKALYWYEKAAEQGHMYAKCHLSSMHANSSVETQYQ